MRPLRGLAARMVLALLLVALLPVSALLAASPASAAEKAWLQAEAKIDGGVVVVRAVLFDAASQPITDRELEVEGLGATELVKTQSDGWATAQLPVPEDQKPGQVTFSVHFKGDDTYSPVDAITTLVLAKSGSTQLTATVADANKQVTPGTPLEVKGVLTLGQGRPVQDASITVTAGGATSDPVPTSAEGAYIALVQVPEDAKPGPLTLKASFEGSKQIAPASTEVTIEVVAPGKDPVEAPSVEKSPEATEQQGDTQEPTVAPATSQAPAPPARTSNTRTGLIVLGGALGALALGGVVFQLARRQQGKDGDNADFIDDEDLVPAPQDRPRRVITRDFDPAQDAPRARRGHATVREETALDKDLDSDGDMVLRKPIRFSDDAPSRPSRANTDAGDDPHAAWRRPSRALPDEPETGTAPRRSADD